MINPRYSFWFGVWTTILLLVASGTVSLTNVFPDAWVPMIKAWAALHGYSGAQPGPMVDAPAPQIPNPQGRKP